MKICCIATWATVALAAVATDAAAVQRGFGPAKCVSVSRSNAGTCVLRTSCAQQDLSNFDISFECLSQTGRQTHSMGSGSFDQEEEYDTDMKCDECLPPQSNLEAGGVSLAAISVSRVGKLRGKEEPKAEWYGPESCVGVWRDPNSGTCVMQTDCDKDVALNVYEFGLICVSGLEKGNEMTRHLFGMDSFAHKETFSTLIRCDKCLALDEYMDGDKAINQLTKDVKGMKAGLKNVSADVVKLKAEVFPAGPAPGPAAAAPAPASAKPEAKPEAKPAKFLADAKVVKAPQQAPEPVRAPPPQQVQTPKHREVSAESEDPSKDVAVQHAKKKASQTVQKASSNDEQDESMGEILEAAVKGAQARGGIVTPTVQAVIDRDRDRKLAVPLQATQVQQHVKHASQQVQEAPPQVREVSQVPRFEIVEEPAQQVNQDSDNDDDRDDAYDGSDDAA